MQNLSLIHQVLDFSSNVFDRHFRIDTMLINRTNCVRTSESLHAVYKPAFCFIAQGRKRALLGEEVFRYDPGHYLLFTVDLPLIFQIEKATSLANSG